MPKADKRLRALAPDVTEKPEDNNKYENCRDDSTAELPGYDPGQASARWTFHNIAPSVALIAT